MSSELFLFDNSFFSDPFSPFPDSAFEIFQEIQENSAAAASDEIASALLSSSPPSVQLQNLQIAGTEHSVKTEECNLNFDTFNNNSFSPQSFNETAFKLMQRSYSSNSFDNTRSFSFRPQFDSVFESHNLHTQFFTSPESSSGQMRRVCSTGDLQKISMQTRTVLSSSPLSTEKSFMEEANFKVGRYSAEERKEKIDRYRAKRTQRNFNKTIKYACRKTLADTRPRIRGRFARNDEAGEIPKASMFHRYEDDDDLWMEGYEEDDERVARKGTFFNVSDCPQYHSYGY
ncbi:hypothetical protein C2S52_008267 [Perilla frutescens var. hirtella]|nr:hypothetical protein C2S52_008267 [Perilla frutescens var. hirtella]